jgi:hypothetical protein
VIGGDLGHSGVRRIVIHINLTHTGVGTALVLGGTVCVSTLFGGGKRTPTPVCVKCITQKSGLGYIFQHRSTTHGLYV